MDKNDPPPSRAFDPPEEAVWHRMISEAAYYRAQKAEFAEETALEHWLAAEGETRTREDPPHNRSSCRRRHVTPAIDPRAEPTGVAVSVLSDNRLCPQPTDAKRRPGGPYSSRFQIDGISGGSHDPQAARRWLPTLFQKDQSRDRKAP
jgi:hypothetical protein